MKKKIAAVCFIGLALYLFAPASKVFVEEVPQALPHAIAKQEYGLNHLVINIAGKSYY